MAYPCVEPWLRDLAGRIREECRLPNVSSFEVSDGDVASVLLAALGRGVSVSLSVS